MIAMTERQSQKRGGRPEAGNPLQNAIRCFLGEYDVSKKKNKKENLDGAEGGRLGVDVDEDENNNNDDDNNNNDNNHPLGRTAGWIPKRYTLYPPLLVLAPNFFSATPAWARFTAQLRDRQEMQTLYGCIIDAFRSQGITHVAVNGPIAPTTGQGCSNVLRSPTGLLPLHGDFGPRRRLWCGDDDPLFNRQPPSEADLSSAFWVHTTQNGGIFQTWAPLWTMFSRGNVGEKARILADGTFEGLDGVDGVLAQSLSEIAVVDMYVGIGYFAFSYLKRGVGRVFGWEVNGWSVEGLRRGCIENGWGVRVLNCDDRDRTEDEKERLGIGVGDHALERLIKELANDRELRMVVFQGNNMSARTTMERIKLLSDRLAKPGESSVWLDIRHINLGLLPSSRMSWEDAIDMLDPKRGGWVHVHENVDVREVERKRDLVVDVFQAHLGRRGKASCSHIEHVKTYAPGVMHCVFDMHIAPNIDSAQHDRE